MAKTKYTKTIVVDKSEIQIKFINNRLRLISNLLAELKAYRSLDEELTDFRIQICNEFDDLLKEYTSDYFESTPSSDEIELQTDRLGHFLEKINTIILKFRRLKETNVVWMFKENKTMKKSELKQLIKEIITEGGYFDSAANIKYRERSGRLLFVDDKIGELSLVDTSRDGDNVFRYRDPNSGLTILLMLKSINNKNKISPFNDVHWQMHNDTPRLEYKNGSLKDFYWSNGHIGGSITAYNTFKKAYVSKDYKTICQICESIFEHYNIGEERRKSGYNVYKLGTDFSSKVSTAIHAANPNGPKVGGEYF